MELSHSYAAIFKADKNPDGTLTVYGKASDESIDFDQQICDDNWLKQAMPDWMAAGGNVREQHSQIAAGVARDYEYKEGDGHYVRALIVDPVSVKKIETGVLKGFSIGIRNARVVRDAKAAAGRIVGGTIIELSVVDRPANPNAKLMLAKAAESGELMAVEQLSVPTPAEVFKSADEAPEPAEAPAEPETPVTEPEVEDQLDMAEEVPVDNPEKSAQPDLLEVASTLLKFDKAAYETARNALADLVAVEAAEMKEGHDERHSLAHLLSSIEHLFEWYEGEIAEGEVSGVMAEAEAGDYLEEVAMSAAADEEMCAKCNEKECKCADKSLTLDSVQIDEILTKAIASAKEAVTTEIETLKSAIAAEKERSESLAAELEVAKSAAVAGGPSRAVLNKSAAQTSEMLLKAADYRAKAGATTDQVLAEGYRALAADLEAKAKKEA